MNDRPFIDTPQRLAEVVASRRAELGLTQADLAARAGVGRRFIVDLEHGHPRAELAKVLGVLDALGLHPRAIPVAPAWAATEDPASATADAVAVGADRG